MGELDVVGVEDVDVVQPQSGEALVYAARHAVGGEVETLVFVAAALGGDDDSIPRNGRVAEAIAEDRLRDRAAVVPERGRAVGPASVGGGGEERRGEGGTQFRRPSTVL
jgi:hypothetical protein